MTTLSHTRTISSRPMPAMLQPRPGKVERATSATIDPLKVLRRYAWLIVASGVLGSILGAAAFLVLQQAYPLYSGSVVFEVQPGLQKSSDVGTMDTASDDMVFRSAQTETYMLTSRDVLETALKNPDVQNTSWGRQFNRNGVFHHSDAMEDLEEDIDTAVRRSSNLFMLNWATHSPSDVPVVLNAIANAYITSRRQREMSVYDQNLQLFRDQLSNTQRELRNTDGEIHQLILASGLTTLDDTRWSAQFHQMQGMMDRATELTTSLNVAQSGLSLVRQQIEGRIQPNPDDRVIAERDPTLQNFSQSLEFQKAQFRKLTETRLPGDQMLVDSERDVRTAEAQFEAKVEEVMIRNLQAKASEMEVSVKRLLSAIEDNAREQDRLNVTLKDLTTKQVDYEALRSQRDFLQEQRQADMQLVNELQMMRTRIDATRVRLAQLSFTPRAPSFPQPQVIIPLGALVLIGLTVGLIFLRELVDQRVKSPSDLAVLPGARVLGSLPDASDDPTRIVAPELVVRRQPNSVLAESYRQAATAILPEMAHAEAQTLLLVGGLPEAGTTTVATNLAAAAAAGGKSVLLVDANFRRPGLAKVMGIAEDAPGLGDVLSNVAGLDETIHDVGEGVSLMPAGSPGNRVFERLNNGLIDGVLADLRSRFDLIIFDAPPAVVAGDAMMLANKVDAAVMVIRANQEHRGLVARMISRLAQSQCELIGVLLNRPRNIAGGYMKKNYAVMADYVRNNGAAG